MTNRRNSSPSSLKLRAVTSVISQLSGEEKTTVVVQLLEKLSPEEKCRLVEERLLGGLDTELMDRVIGRVDDYKRCRWIEDRLNMLLDDFVGVAVISEDMQASAERFVDVMREVTVTKFTDHGGPPEPNLIVWSHPSLKAVTVTTSYASQYFMGHEFEHSSVETFRMYTTGTPKEDAFEISCGRRSLGKCAHDDHVTNSDSLKVLCKELGLESEGDAQALVGIFQCVFDRLAGLPSHLREIYPPAGWLLPQFWNFLPEYDD